MNSQQSNDTPSLTYEQSRNFQQEATKEYLSQSHQSPAHGLKQPTTIRQSPCNPGLAAQHEQVYYHTSQHQTQQGQYNHDKAGVLIHQPVANHGLRRQHQRYPSRVGDHYLVLSVGMTILCLLCGSWFSLVCTVPAVIMSIMARDAEHRGDFLLAKQHGRLSLGLNIASVVMFIFVIVISGVIVLIMYLSVWNAANTLQSTTVPTSLPTDFIP